MNIPIFNDEQHGTANTLAMPNMDAANISSNLLRMLDGGVAVGPMLVSAAKPAYILTSTVTVRGLVNMTALAVVQAQTREEVEKIA
jgi:malate dehydrogenase (oxaloacetate-decarboxylating)(NADP+)